MGVMPRRTDGHAYPRLDWFGDEDPPPVTFRERRLAIATGMPAPREQATLTSSHEYQHLLKDQGKKFFHRPRRRRLRYDHHHHGVEPRMADRAANSTVASVCVSHAAPPHNAAALVRSRSANHVRMSLPPVYAGYPLPRGTPTVACVCDQDAPRIRVPPALATSISNINATMNPACCHVTAPACSIRSQRAQDDLSLSQRDVTSSSPSASGCPSMSASSLRVAIPNLSGSKANSVERVAFVERPRLLSSSSVSDSEDGYVDVRTAFVEAPRQISLHKSVKNGMQHFARCTSKLCPHPEDVD